MSGPMASIPPPVNPTDPGRGPWVVAVTWLFTAIAMLTTGIWFYGRRKKNMSPGWDCWLMLIATTIRIAFQCTITYSLKYGMGKHDRDLWPWELVQILKWNWIALPGAVVTSTLARVSVTILLIRLFGLVHKWFKWFLIIMTVVQVVGGIVLIPITFLQAQPTEALWNVFYPNATTWDPRVWLYTAYFVQSVNSFSDLTYVAFPVAFIWNLQMPARERIGLIFVMALSIFTMLMSILKTYWIYTASQATKASVDVQYNATFQVLFGVLEQCVVIIMGCIPSIRHVFLESVLLSALGNSLASLLRSSRSRSVGGSGGSKLPSSSNAGFYDLEDRSGKTSGTGAPGQAGFGSQDGLVRDGMGKHGEQVNVKTYANRTDRDNV
ncbi:hypothetical protein K505DRAFT_420135 [Melanomma pulvis-pyrius CBS 109.77]|uniref:Rhodopsin domain-containing protein n=1 Tax=Melanomma pulvis-pyrius CBS 109.77 TaxID=1314802 RepID=A0A6A6X1F4_9PLEO|nr:hypothetical protein K505DRAFT_420135 [Melanomma pulvis-pyrius CBS 109.77]